jgi:hypothetical protein
VGTGTVGVVEPAVRQRDLGTRRALAAAGVAELGDGEGLGGVEAGEQGVQRRQGVDERQRVAEGAAGTEALEVPGDVLAELRAAALLAHVLAQQLGVAAHHLPYLAQRREHRRLRPTRRERRGQVAEQPRAT